MAEQKQPVIDKHSNPSQVVSLIYHLQDRLNKLEQTVKEALALTEKNVNRCDMRITLLESREARNAAYSDREGKGRA